MNLFPIKLLLRYFGFDIVRYMQDDMGVDPYIDMKYLVRNSSPLIIDGGANLGESAKSFLLGFPGAQLICFEPCRSSADLLETKLVNVRGCSVLGCGLGSTDSYLDFYENEFPFMSSFLRAGPYSYGTILDVYPVKVVRLDTFAYSNNIAFIDILKLDLQGFEMEALQGAHQLLEGGLVGLVNVELTFSKMYQDWSSPWKIVDLMESYGFVFVGLYRQHFQDNILSWADAIFANKSYINYIGREIFSNS